MYHHSVSHSDVQYISTLKVTDVKKMTCYETVQINKKLSKIDSLGVTEERKTNKIRFNIEKNACQNLTAIQL